MIHFDKGDFLIFASLSSGLGLSLLPNQITDLTGCEISPGVYIRHPRLGSGSRSDISRDGYMGVIFKAVAQNDNDALDRIIKAGWSRRWQMGSRGLKVYTNIWPLVPTLYMARYGRWVPTIPTFMLNIKGSATGFRAHLTALHIMTEMLKGKRRWSHKQGLRVLCKNNPGHKWFRSLLEVYEFVPVVEDMNNRSWGGCPAAVLDGLIKCSENLRKRLRGSY